MFMPQKRYWRKLQDGEWALPKILELPLVTHTHQWGSLYQQHVEDKVNPHKVRDRTKQLLTKHYWDVHIEAYKAILKALTEHVTDFDAHPEIWEKYIDKFLQHTHSNPKPLIPLETDTPQTGQIFWNKEGKFAVKTNTGAFNFGIVPKKDNVIVLSEYLKPLLDFVATEEQEEEQSTELTLEEKIVRYMEKEFSSETLKKLSREELIDLFFVKLMVHIPPEQLRELITPGRKLFRDYSKVKDFLFYAYVLCSYADLGKWLLGIGRSPYQGAALVNFAPYMQWMYYSDFPALGTNTYSVGSTYFVVVNDDYFFYPELRYGSHVWSGDDWSPYYRTETTPIIEGLANDVRTVYEMYPNFKFPLVEGINYDSLKTISLENIEPEDTVWFWCLPENLDFLQYPKLNLSKYLESPVEELKKEAISTNYKLLRVKGRVWHQEESEFYARAKKILVGYKERIERIVGKELPPDNPLAWYRYLLEFIEENIQPDKRKLKHLAFLLNALESKDHTALIQGDYLLRKLNKHWLYAKLGGNLTWKVKFAGEIEDKKFVPYVFSYNEETLNDPVELPNLYLLTEPQTEYSIAVLIVLLTSALEVILDLIPEEEKRIGVENLYGVVVTTVRHEGGAKAITHYILSPYVADKLYRYIRNQLVSFKSVTNPDNINRPLRLPHSDEIFSIEEKLNREDVEHVSFYFDISIENSDWATNFTDNLFAFGSSNYEYGSEGTVPPLSAHMNFFQSTDISVLRIGNMPDIGVGLYTRIVEGEEEFKKLEVKRLYQLPESIPYQFFHRMSYWGDEIFTSPIFYIKFTNGATYSFSTVVELLGHLFAHSLILEQWENLFSGDDTGLGYVLYNLVDFAYRQERLALEEKEFLKEDKYTPLFKDNRWKIEVGTSVVTNRPIFIPILPAESGLANIYVMHYAWYAWAIEKTYGEYNVNGPYLRQFHFTEEGVDPFFYLADIECSYFEGSYLSLMSLLIPYFTSKNLDIKAEKLLASFFASYRLFKRKIYSWYTYKLNGEDVNLYALLDPFLVRLSYYMAKLNYTESDKLEEAACLVIDLYRDLFSKYSPSEGFNIYSSSDEEYILLQNDLVRGSRFHMPILSYGGIGISIFPFELVPYFQWGCRTAKMLQTKATEQMAKFVVDYTNPFEGPVFEANKLYPLLQGVHFSHNPFTVFRTIYL